MLQAEADLRVARKIAEGNQNRLKASKARAAAFIQRLARMDRLDRLCRSLRESPDNVVLSEVRELVPDEKNYNSLPGPARKTAKTAVQLVVLRGQKETRKMAKRLLSKWKGVP